MEFVRRRRCLDPGVSVGGSAAFQSASRCHAELASRLGPVIVAFFAKSFLGSLHSEGNFACGLSDRSRALVITSSSLSGRTSKPWSRSCMYVHTYGEPTGSVSARQLIRCRFWHLCRATPASSGPTRVEWLMATGYSVQRVSLSLRGSSSVGASSFSVIHGPPVTRPGLESSLSRERLASCDQPILVAGLGPASGATPHAILELAPGHVTCN